jgi:hypothetical protein
MLYDNYRGNHKNQQMLPLKKSYSRTKKIVVGAIIALVLLVSAVLYVYAFNGSLFGWSNGSTTSTTPATKTTSTPSGITPSTTPATGTSKGSDQTSSTAPKDTSQIPASNTSSVTITQLSEGANNVTATASITNAGQESTCSFVFTNPYNKPITVQSSVVNGSCGPISIPNDSFPSIGDWKLTVTYFYQNTQATAEKVITIK